MTDGYALDIEGDTFEPVPEAWLEADQAVDERPGQRPRIYAVSVARLSRRHLKLRYAQPRTNNVLQFTVGAMPAGDGEIEPANLHLAGQTWPRSMVPVADPQDVLRVEEIEHFRDLWADRVAGIRSDDELVADGGRPESLMAEQTGEERLVAEWSSQPYTGVRKRRYTVSHRVLVNWYPAVGVDVRHQIRCEPRDLEDWVLAEAWEFRDHGIEHYTTQHGRGLP